jgi:hypothetical protein
MRSCAGVTAMLWPNATEQSVYVSVQLFRDSTCPLDSPGHPIAVREPKPYARTAA